MEVDTLDLRLLWAMAEAATACLILASPTCLLWTPEALRTGRESSVGPAFHLPRALVHGLGIRLLWAMARAAGACLLRAFLACLLRAPGALSSLEGFSFLSSAIEPPPSLGDGRRCQSLPSPGISGMSVLRHSEGDAAWQCEARLRQQVPERPRVWSRRCWHRRRCLAWSRIS